MREGQRLSRHRHAGRDLPSTAASTTSTTTCCARRSGPAPLRDMMTSGLRDQPVAAGRARLNTIMKQLSGWAAIIAVPTPRSRDGSAEHRLGYNQSSACWSAARCWFVGSLVLYLVFRARTGCSAASAQLRSRAERLRRVRDRPSVGRPARRRPSRRTRLLDRGFTVWSAPLQQSVRQVRRQQAR